MDGSYPILTVAKKDDSALSKEDFKQIHSMFKVEGQKWTEHNLEQTSDSSIKAVNHRGYSMKAPENTLAAYRESALHGFKIVECDVWFTSDNQAVLLHDETIDRTSNGSGKIENMTLNQVRQYDFGSWKDSEYIGEKIPTFSEFMELCQELELHPYIELKSGLSLEKAHSLVNTVKNYGMLDNVSWISFGSDSLKNIVIAYNKARVGYLVNDVTSGVISTANNLKTGYNEVFIDCNISKVTESDVTLCKNASYPLEVWTVNKPSDVSKIDSYVSGVTSDWMIIGDYLKK